MTAEEQNRERRYQIAMHFARQMLEQGIINDDDYKVIDTRMTQKYTPVFGTLLSEMRLLSGE